MHKVASLLKNHKHNRNPFIKANKTVYIGCHPQHSLLTIVGKYLYSRSQLYHWCIQPNKHLCTIMIVHRKLKESISYIQRLCYLLMLYGADLMFADKSRGFGPWMYLISDIQRHNVHQVKVCNSSMSLMHICTVSYVDFDVDCSDNREQELTPGGWRHLIDCPLFRRKWASYTGDCNKRWTAQLQSASKTSLHSLLLVLKTEQEREGLQGRSCELGLFGEFPWLPPLLFESYQCLLTFRCSLSFEWTTVCFWSFWLVVSYFVRNIGCGTVAWMQRLCWFTLQVKCLGSVRFFFF